MSGYIDIRPLKEMALKLSDPVKTLILSEKRDFLEAEEYLAKTTEWLKLMKLGAPKT